MARDANERVKHAKDSDTREGEGIHHEDGDLENIDDDYQTQFDPDFSDEEDREEVEAGELCNDGILPPKTSKETEDGLQAMDAVTRSRSVSNKAAKLANTFRSLYKPCAPSNLKNPPELGDSSAKGDNPLSATIDTHASTTPSVMSGLSGPSSSLRASSFESLHHGHVPAKETTTDNDLNNIKMGEVKPGAPGHKWFLTVRLPVTHALSLEGRSFLVD